MEKFVIDGGAPLSGTVVPAGNKNGALPILAAALLTEEPVVVRNVPRIADVVLVRKMPLLLDVKDVSTEDVRIELELKKEADEQKVLAYLFKNTPLQTNFAVNLTCLVPTENPEVGRPERLDLRAMLWHFLHFRLDVVTKRGEYAGGVIVPGVGISADALFQRAARLPRVEVRNPGRVVGRTTVASIQSGLYFGYAAMVEGLIARIRAELGERARVVATGGLAETLAAELPSIERVDPVLTLNGLRLIWERNRAQRGD